MKFEESKMQEACVMWFDYSYPKLRLNLFAVPNERKADIKTNQRGKTYSPHGARMKALGRRRGVADMYLSVPKWEEQPQYIFHGFFLEFKTDKGKQSEEQAAFEKSVVSHGYKYLIVRSKEQFITEIEKYLSK